MTNIKPTKTKQEMEEIQDFCLALRNDNVKLADIQKKVEEEYGESRTIMQVGRWIKSAAERLAKDDNLMDFNVKMVKGMGELDALQCRIEKILDEKVIKYDYKDAKGHRKQEIKTISPMFLTGLLNTLAIVLDKKNQIRGLNNNQMQMLVQQNYNSYNNNIQVGDDFKHLDPGVQKELKDIFQESEQLSDINSALTIDGEGSVIDEGN